ncbi:MAG TPA: CocE/NonD family hydrolase [Candidatus Thermoplasmatota archaeon]|nr:CocE/NonD family hydrolase [Candidatus Thermoplasmatota archaeon]
MLARSRFLALAFILVTPVLAGCITAEVTPEAPVTTGPSTEAWLGNLSAAKVTGMVSTVVHITSADGTSLSLTVHLPDPLPASGKIPTLLQITPYQAGRAYTPATGTAPPVGSMWQSVVFRGAAYVEADARGTNGSDGCLDFGGSKDREDAAAFVAWIRDQPWSNGVVVTDGISHPGMGSLVAHVAVPDLTAALAHAPVVSYYRDEWYQGAKFEDQNNGLGYQIVESEAAPMVTPESLKAQAAPCTGQTYLEYSSEPGTFGEKWADRDLSLHLENAKAPVLLTQGFIDQNVFPDHVQAYWDALPENFPKYVIWGWWYHGWPDMTGHQAERFRDLRMRWLDATLFGVDNSVLNDSRVLVEDSTGVWHEGRDWPLEPSERVTLFPSAEGSLGSAAPSKGSVDYQDRLGAARGAWTDAHVAFRSEPLTADRLVNGAPTVTLVASSTHDNTKWVVYLLDEAPDGSWERVTHGYADSHTWGKPDEWLPLEPGKPYAWTVNLMPTAVVVEKGHRLVLLVASQDSRYQMDPATGDYVPFASPRHDFCWDDRRGGCYRPSGILPADSRGKAVNTVHTGPEGTRLHLAWVDPALTKKAPAQTVGVPIGGTVNDEPRSGFCRMMMDGASRPGVVGVSGLHQMGGSCAFESVAVGNLSSYRSALVEVAWKADPFLTVTARGQSFDCFGECSLGEARGGSGPLRFVVDGAVYAENADASPYVLILVDGVARQVPVTVAVTFFREETPPDGFTALATDA